MKNASRCRLATTASFGYGAAGFAGPAVETSHFGNPASGRGGFGKGSFWCRIFLSSSCIATVNRRKWEAHRLSG